MATPVFTNRPREIVVPGGERTGYNGTGSTIGAGLFVTGQESSISLPSGNTSPIYGVTRKSVADKSIGSLIQSGRAIMVVGATSVAAGNQVMPEAATGKAIPFTSGNACGGLAMTSGTAGQEIEVDLDAGLTAQ